MLKKLLHPKSILLVVTIFAFLYGVSYQQFRHFDVHDPRGASDAGYSYIPMSYGKYAEASRKHKHRFVIPTLAAQVRKVLEPVISNRDELNKLSFYVVNFLIVSMTAFLFFLILRQLKFDWKLSYLGMVMFLGSRITILSTGTPLVDSMYYWAIAVIVYLTLTERSWTLTFLTPILIFSKETIFPFLFLPFLVKNMRKPYLLASVLASFVLVFFARQYVLELSAVDGKIPAGHSFVDVVLERIDSMAYHVPHFFTLRGLHTIQNGFSFFLIFAVLGYFVNKKKQKYPIPKYLLLMLPVSLGFGILNSGLGRMLFASYIIIIAYALIFIEDCMERGELSEKEKAS